MRIIIILNINKLNILIKNKQKNFYKISIKINKFYYKIFKFNIKNNKFNIKNTNLILKTQI